MWRPETTTRRLKCFWSTRKSQAQGGNDKPAQGCGPSPGNYLRNSTYKVGRVEGGKLWVGSYDFNQLQSRWSSSAASNGVIRCPSPARLRKQPPAQPVQQRGPSVRATYPKGAPTILATCCPANVGNSSRREALCHRGPGCSDGCGGNDQQAGEGNDHAPRDCIQAEIKSVLTMSGGPQTVCVVQEWLGATRDTMHMVQEKGRSQEIEDDGGKEERMERISGHPSKLIDFRKAADDVGCSQEADRRLTSADR
ncbi:hypothetical protein B0H10DRAFT_1938011 [Mycena sp. CBHHK59/15]|nr:hypothetical protein B0H10DRAFT_1938011 [Mycena sp. CBHHK59/15]